MLRKSTVGDRRSWQVALLLLLLPALLAARPANASFGFELEDWEGKPGDVIRVEGSGILTCCPTNTPAEAELLLEIDQNRPSTRLTLFAGVFADESGYFATSFSVPDVPERGIRTWVLRAISRGVGRTRLHPG